MAQPIDLAGMEIRGGSVIPVPDAEVAALERNLGVRLPDGYQEWVTTLGEGTFRNFVRVFPPSRILDDLQAHRGMMAGYWFWDAPGERFGQEEAMESIPLGETLQGDVLVFHPAERDKIYVLPRHEERLHVLGPSLIEAVEWVSTPGVLGDIDEGTFFEPQSSRGDVATPSLREGVPSMKPPDLTKPPREVLRSYFAELRDIEEASLNAIGGPKALKRNDPPESSDEDFERLLAWTEAVHGRYCSLALAKAHSGASVVVSWPLAHDPSSIRILDEAEKRSGRVVIRTSEGTDMAFLREYTLEQSNGDWRIVSEKDLGLDESVGSSGGGIRGTLGRLFGGRS